MNPNSDNYAEMDQRGLLVGSGGALPLHLPFWDKRDEGRAFVRYYDATNPEARHYIWTKVTDGYGRYGIRAFWLDALRAKRCNLKTPKAPCIHLGAGMEVTERLSPRACTWLCRRALGERRGRGATGFA